MQKLGGAAILMQQSLISEEESKALSKVNFIVGDANLYEEATNAAPLEPFSQLVIEYMNDVAKELRLMREAKAYPDVVTLGFWIRKSSAMALCDKYNICDGNIHLGRGMAFHIAPSNVPVNYAYSLFTGLMCGNANVVRIPSKDFEQTEIINRAISAVLQKEEYETLRKYIFLVRYDRNKDINDVLSAHCDVRIIWGGDATISEIRKSPLKARATEVTFADRYSLAVIDSDEYMKSEDKKKIADGFYNDTYLTDQNACTSPRIVVWTGGNKEEARKIFWDELMELVKVRYSFQSIMGVNKLSSAYLIAAKCTGEKIKVQKHDDNLLVRVQVPTVSAELMEYKDNSGYFFEYMCDDILELRDLCDNTHCQTVGIIGDTDMIKPLLLSGIKGIDRVVPVGKTMDFDFIWDGYNLYERLTRTIMIQ